MKSTLKSLIAATAIISTLAVPAFAIYTDSGEAGDTHYGTCGLGTHEIGVKKSFGGENTYGFSWVDPDERINCYTQTTIGGVKFSKQYGVGWAQSQQEFRPGNVRVSEHHGTY